jgi:hypothetical protein
MILMEMASAAPTETAVTVYSLETMIVSLEEHFSLLIQRIFLVIAQPTLSLISRKWTASQSPRRMNVVGPACGLEMGIAVNVLKRRSKNPLKSAQCALPQESRAVATAFSRGLNSAADASKSHLLGRISK